MWIEKPFMFIPFLSNRKVSEDDQTVLNFITRSIHRRPYQAERCELIQEETSAFNPEWRWFYKYNNNAVDAVSPPRKAKSDS